MVLAHREEVDPADRAASREWLLARHDTSPGVWVAVQRHEPAEKRLSVAEAVEEALCFGWIDSTVRSAGPGRATVLFTPRRQGSTWSRINKERVARLAAEGWMTPAGQAVIDRARSDGSWALLDDIDAIRVPSDLMAALADNPRARAGWDALAPSAKKQALWWISTARRPQTRARRIEVTVTRVSGAADVGRVWGLSVGSPAAWRVGARTRARRSRRPRSARPAAALH